MAKDLRGPTVTVRRGSYTPQPVVRPRTGSIKPSFQANSPPPRSIADMQAQIAKALEATDPVLQRPPRDLPPKFFADDTPPPKAQPKPPKKEPVKQQKKSTAKAKPRKAAQTARPQYSGGEGAYKYAPSTGAVGIGLTNFWDVLTGHTGRGFYKWATTNYSPFSDLALNLAVRPVGKIIGALADGNRDSSNRLLSSRRAGVLGQIMMAAAVASVPVADLEPINTPFGTIQLENAIQENVESAARFGSDIAGYGLESAQLLNFGGEINISNGDRSIIINQDSPLFDLFARLGQGNSINIGAQDSPVLFTRDMAVPFTLSGVEQLQALNNAELLNSYLESAVIERFDADFYATLPADLIEVYMNKVMDLGVERFDAEIFMHTPDSLLERYMGLVVQAGPEAYPHLADIPWPAVERILERSFLNTEGREYIQARSIMATIVAGIHNNDADRTQYFLGLRYYESRLGVLDTSTTGAGGDGHFIGTTARQQFRINQADLIVYAEDHLQDNEIIETVANADRGADYASLRFISPVSAFVERSYTDQNIQQMLDAGISESTARSPMGMYMAWNSGATGAIALLRANGNSSARAVVDRIDRRIAASNPDIYRGNPTVREVRSRYADRMATSQTTAMHRAAELFGQDFQGALDLGLMERHRQEIIESMPVARRPVQTVTQLALNR